MTGWAAVGLFFVTLAERDLRGSNWCSQGKPLLPTDGYDRRRKVSDMKGCMAEPGGLPRLELLTTRPLEIVPPAEGAEVKD